MNLTRLKLQRLSICPCGFTVLHDDIKVGTEYEVDMASLRGGYTYGCGGCGKRYQVFVVDAASRIDPEIPLMPLPYDLFQKVQ